MAKLKLSDYIVTLSDIFRVFRSMFALLRASTWYDVLGGIFVIVIVVTLKLYTSLGLDDIALWICAIWIFYWDMDGNVAVKAALVGLIVIPLLLWLGEHWFIYGADWAEIVAVWVYLLLVIGVAKHIADFKQEDNDA